MRTSSNIKRNSLAGMFRSGLERREKRLHRCKPRGARRRTVAVSHQAIRQRLVDACIDASCGTAHRTLKRGCRTRRPQHLVAACIDASRGRDACREWRKVPAGHAAAVKSQPRRAGTAHLPLEAAKYAAGLSALAAEAAAREAWPACRLRHGGCSRTCQVTGPRRKRRL